MALKVVFLMKLKLLKEALRENIIFRRANSTISQKIKKVGIIMGDTEFLVGWFTLSMINVGIVQGKNRNSLSWFFISLFLGPIATFIIVVFLENNYLNDGGLRS